MRAYRADDTQFSAYSQPAQTTTEACTLPAPALLAPADGELTTNNTPLLAWSAVAGATDYQVQIATGNEFSSPLQDDTLSSTSYTAGMLPDGQTVYWRVRALAAGGGVSAWSGMWTIQIDTRRPAAPELKGPKDHATTADTTPKFTWKNVRGTSAYTLHVSTQPDFSDPVVYKNTTRPVYLVPAADALDYGVYYWRVLATDKDGNQSDWSLVHTLEVTLHKSPKNAQHLTDTTPVFRWASVRGKIGYELEIYSDADLTNLSDSYAGGATRYVADALPFGEQLGCVVRAKHV